MVIVGIFVVIGSVIGGCLMEGGALEILLHPAKLDFIGAATIGSLPVRTSPAVVRALMGQLTARRHEQCIKALPATWVGLSPALAIEFTRRVLPSHVRPSVERTEQTCKAPRDGGAAAAA